MASRACLAATSFFFRSRGPARRRPLFFWDPGRRLFFEIRGLAGRGFIFLRSEALKGGDFFFDLSNEEDVARHIKKDVA